MPSGRVLLQVVLVGILTGGVYALMVSGLTLIFGVMRVINIAHGAFLVLGAYISYWLFTLYGLDPVLSLLVSVPLFFLIGVGLQLGLLSRVRQDPGLIVLLTFALAISIEGLIGAFWESTARTVRTSYIGAAVPLSLGDFSVRLPVVRLVGFGVALAVLSVLYLLIKRSDLGRAIRSTIQNETAAQLVGVDVARVRALTFGIGLATVAAGAALFSLIWSFQGGAHVIWITRMLAIIVLGGLGSLPGALVAALLMGVIEGLASVTVSTYLSPLVFYGVLFLVLVLRPQGLMGTRIREG